MKKEEDNSQATQTFKAFEAALMFCCMGKVCIMHRA